MSALVLKVLDFAKISCNGTDQERYKLQIHKGLEIHTTWLFRPPQPVCIRAGAVLEHTEIVDYASIEKVKEILDKEAIVQASRPKVEEKSILGPYFKRNVQKKELKVNEQLTLF